jgi:ribonuclease HII
MKALTLAELAARARAGTLTRRELAALADDPRQGVQKLVQSLKATAAATTKERRRLRGMLSLERDLWDQGVTLVAGVDEVGAGPLAGPVVAAAVILPVGTSIPDIDDSKKLLPALRRRLDAEIRSQAVAWALGVCTAQEIDQLNIYHAACEAMRRAVLALTHPVEHLLVDARRVPGVRSPQTALVKGDSLSQSIAAASIVAKVARDAMMDQLDVTYPGYGFAQHHGYGTAVHQEALVRLGPCPEHRRSFAPVASALAAGLTGDAEDGLYGGPSAYDEAGEEEPGAGVETGIEPAARACAEADGRGDLDANG